jgi:dihydroorotate dehydrogenase (fumarate)
MRADVTASYLGLPLRSPLIVGACHMTLVPETVRELTIAGAGAIVLPSPPTFAYQPIGHLRAEPGLGPGCARAGSAVIGSNTFSEGTDRYLGTIATLKRHTGIPIIANLSDCIEQGWLDLAREIEDHGADAIELSLYPDSSDPSLSASDVESPLISAVESLCEAVSIPVSIKLLPFVTSLPNLAWRLTEAGAKGIVLFGREPVWQVVEGQMSPSSHWSLSDSSQLQMTLSGLIRLRSADPDISVAASGGISTARDVFDVVIAGADVAMVTSEIFRTGPDAIAHILEGIVSSLQRQQVNSFKSYVERSHAILPPPAPVGRADLAP